MKKNLLTLDVALSKEIKYMLKEEHYLPGDKLPSERKLAELFHVQRLTVRGALDLLLQDKTIISKPRSGYYVAPKRILQSIRNFSLHSEEDSGQLTYELYDFKKIIVLISNFMYFFSTWQSCQVTNSFHWILFFQFSAVLLITAVFLTSLLFFWLFSYHIQYIMSLPCDGSAKLYHNAFQSCLH